jgi:hypothetical protein
MWVIRFLLCHCEEERSDDEAIPYDEKIASRLFRRRASPLAMTYSLILLPNLIPMPSQLARGEGDDQHGRQDE